MLTFLPFYCTPFFSRCKEKFYKFSKFFENFFEREGNFGRCLPKKGKNGAQGFPKGAFPQKDPKEQTGRIPRTQVTVAQGKIQVQPDPEENRQKKKVR
ncbi:MAG: hypothetical protein IJO45_01520 [Oscillospiraceae bacterium]|nr:hypothetical protein [Oscillospiraceae bacterium]